MKKGVKSINVDTLKLVCDELESAFNNLLNPLSNLEKDASRKLSFYKGKLNLNDDIDKLIKNHELITDFLNSKIAFYSDKNLEGNIDSSKTIINEEMFVPIKKQEVKKNEIPEVSSLTIKPETKKKNIFFPKIFYNFYVIMAIIILIAGGCLYFIFSRYNNSYALVLNGEEKVSLEVGDEYHDSGCTLFDRKKQIVRENIEIINNVDTSKEGHYNVICLYRNLRVERDVTVSKNKISSYKGDNNE